MTQKQDLEGANHVSIDDPKFWIDNETRTHPETPFTISASDVLNEKFYPAVKCDREVLIDLLREVQGASSEKGRRIFATDPSQIGEIFADPQKDFKMESIPGYDPFASEPMDRIPGYDPIASEPLGRIPGYDPFASEPVDRVPGYDPKGTAK